MSQWGRKTRKSVPADFDVVSQTLTALENELRDKVNESHEGKRKNESQWPVHQLNWQRTRYIYDLHYKYSRISKELVDYLVEIKTIDGALMSYWQKPGYERLCSTFAVNTGNSKFGTVGICRVPAKNITEGTIVENETTGCRGCASDAKNKNIFWNKYGEYLADIHMAREIRAAKKAKQDEGDGDNSDEDDSDDDGADNGPVGAADGSSGEDRNDLWKKKKEKIDVEALEKVASEAQTKRAAEDGGKKKAKFEPPGKRRRAS